MRRDKADGASLLGGSRLYPKGRGEPLKYFKESRES